jgi:hypothetical protein
MKRTSTILCLLIGVTLLIHCKGSSPRYVKTETPPSIIRQHKRIKVYANRPVMVNTGVRITKGDIYTVLASGKAQTHAHLGRDAFGPSAGYFRLKIGNGVPNIPLIGITAKTIKADSTGNIYLGISDGSFYPSGQAYHPERYKNNSGFFNVDLFLWSREDYSAIEEYFKTLELDPSNDRALSETLNQLSGLVRLEELSKFSKNTEKAIADTKSQLNSLQTSQMNQAGSNEQPDPRVKDLESQLAQLTERLKQIDDLKKQLAAGNQQIETLTKSLMEKEQREKELVTRIQKLGSVPPFIAIVTPQNHAIVETDILRFSAVVEDSEGIEKISVFVNGQKVDTADARGIGVARQTPKKHVSLSMNLKLKEGINDVEVRATDTEGLTEGKTVTVECQKINKNIWAVVIGINKYKNITPLKYAVADAKAFYKHLTEQLRVPKENVSLLLDESADLRQMRSILGTHLKRKASKDDYVILYFAGHGGTEKDSNSPDGDGLEKYLLPVNVDPDDLYASGLPMREITRIFDRISAEKLVFFADACYSGASGGRTFGVSGIRAHISDKFLDRITKGKGRVILTASGANEVSAENPEIGHGVFTYFLLEGLNGRADFNDDGLITIDETYDYVSEKVPEATGQAQHPVKKGAVEGKFIVGFSD